MFFISKIGLDHMELENKAVIHIVDLQTHFATAYFLQDKRMYTVWATFIKCWDTVYNGYPDIIRADQG